MRYKNNVLDKLTQVDATINRITIQVNRNVDPSEVSDSIQTLKEQLEGVREMISIEPDDFEQQFVNR
jgi:hypothetical protein